MFIWLIVTSIALVANIFALPKDNVVGEVRNLTVQLLGLQQPRQQDLDDVPLRFNISWLHPQDGRRPSFYSVLVTSVGAFPRDNETTRSNSCTEGSIYHAGEDVNQTVVVLPENRFDTAGDETALELEPGCSYRVQVFANPRNNLDAPADAASPSTIITIPNCVGSRCNCDRAVDALPVPSVTVRSLHNGSNIITWKLDSSKLPDDIVHSYKISVGIPHLTSSSGLVVYNKTRIFTGNTQNDSFIWDQEKLKKGTKIFVSAQDVDGCSGKEGTYIVKRTKHPPFYKRNATALFFAGFVAICVTISGIVSFVKYLARNNNYKLISLTRKSTRQIHNVLHNSRIEALLKHRNALYVEQETQMLPAKDEGFPSKRRIISPAKSEARRKDLVDDYEISYGRLELVRELGQGQFGKVYLANLMQTAQNEEGRTLVAVKMSLTSLDSARAQLELRQQLLEEISIIKIAGSHPHLVGLIGCCTLTTNPVCLVLEYMEGGDLLGYLHRMRDAQDAAMSTANKSPESPGGNSLAETTCTSLGSQSPTTPTSRVFFANDIKPEEVVSFESEGAISHAEMLRFALEIAKGMEHLEAKGIVHRDLAARNILMDQHLTLKISDFGLSRNGAYTVGRGGVRRLPVRWMPPEAIVRRAFTSKSDVWSYGLVLWEIGSFGDFPYPRLSDEQVLKYLIEEDGRPEAEDARYASTLMRDMMDMCWANRPERRPDFRQILLSFETRITQHNKTNPVYLELDT